MHFDCQKKYLCTREPTLLLPTPWNPTLIKIGMICALKFNKNCAYCSNTIWSSLLSPFYTMLASMKIRVNYYNCVILFILSVIVQVQLAIVYKRDLIWHEKTAWTTSKILRFMLIVVFQFRLKFALFKYIHRIVH